MSIWSKKLNLNFQNNNDDSDTDDDCSKEIDDEFIRISEIDAAQLNWWNAKFNATMSRVCRFISRPNLK